MYMYTFTGQSPFSSFTRQGNFCTSPGDPLGPSPLVPRAPVRAQGADWGPAHEGPGGPSEPIYVFTSYA